MTKSHNQLISLCKLTSTKGYDRLLSERASRGFGMGNHMKTKTSKTPLRLEFTPVFDELIAAHLEVYRSADDRECDRADRRRRALAKRMTARQRELLALFGSVLRRIAQPKAAA